MGDAYALHPGGLSSAGPWREARARVPGLEARAGQRERAARLRDAGRRRPPATLPRGLRLRRDLPLPLRDDRQRVREVRGAGRTAGGVHGHAVRATGPGDRLRPELPVALPELQRLVLSEAGADAAAAVLPAHQAAV